ncbi:MAG: hypothetical protein ACTSUN_08940, partial [Promethearchaeota archaeon]
MSSISKEKFQELLRFMRNKGLDALLFIDMVHLARDPNLLCLSGHPNDAVLIVLNSGEKILFPLNLSLAKKRASVDSIADMSTINNKWELAIEEFFKERFPKKKPVVGITKKIFKALYQKRSILTRIALHNDIDDITS